jgi:hypothetical protein
MPSYGDTPLKQLCPICRNSVEPNRRYRRYVCNACVDKAVSADGRRVAFYNANLFGGCVGEYVDTREPYLSEDCIIAGIKCQAEEARFGGIVIEAVI